MISERSPSNYGRPDRNAIERKAEFIRGLRGRDDTGGEKERYHGAIREIREYLVGDGENLERMMWYPGWVAEDFKTLLNELNESEVDGVGRVE